MEETAFHTWVWPLLAGVTAGWLSRPLWLILSGLVLQGLQALPLYRDLVPSVRGLWKNQYREPDEEGNVVDAGEILSLHQVGRLVWGEGKRDDGQGGPFRYRGKLVRNTFIGTHLVVGRKSPVGLGAFELQIHNNDRKMIGHCVWHDTDTDKIECSEFMMKRVDE